MIKYISMALLVVFVLTVIGLTGEEILEAMDKNRDHGTIAFSATMTIHSGKKVRNKNMDVQGKTEGSKSIVRFTNPEDRGTKFLMLDDELWIYFPGEDETVKISGHMLKKGMMGSDVSYEDALESDKLKEKYTITLSGTESFKDHECYVITLDAKVRKAPYFKRKTWVDKKNFVPWKEEMYAKSGKLLKVSEVLEMKKIGKRYFPVASEMRNMLKKNSKTVFKMKDIKLDVPMSENIFGWRYLKQW
jgi:outer membrane lipoprotein-sorting protein